MKAEIPLVSVIIPTHKRPQYLPRAVASALESSSTTLEVIVVPNGGDESWHESLAPWRDDPRVIITPIEEANGDAARNHGMSLAKGKYLHFLDDDDWLLPGAAGRQVELLERTSADVCSGLTDCIDVKGHSYGFASMPATNDFVCAAVSLSGFQLTTGNMYLRERVIDVPWDPVVRRAQDFAWILDLACKRELSLVHLNEVVGAWYQHSNWRVSSTAALTDRREAIIQRLLKLHHVLRTEGRVNNNRLHALAAMLWDYAHRGYPYHPVYWHKVARVARLIDLHSRPNVPAYREGWLQHLNPLFAEAILYPPRRVTRWLRDHFIGPADCPRKL